MPERSTFGGGHPDPETLAAYADEALDDRATAEVERHIAECEECYELVTEVLRATAVEEPVAASAPAVPAAEVVPFVRRRIVVSITAALVGAATMFLAVWTYRSDSRSGERMAPLVAAVRGTRYFEGRLSNGFEYADIAAGDPRGGTADQQSRAARSSGRAPEAGSGGHVARDAACLGSGAVAARSARRSHQHVGTSRGICGAGRTPSERPGGCVHLPCVNESRERLAESAGGR